MHPWGSSRLRGYSAFINIHFWSRPYNRQVPFLMWKAMSPLRQDFRQLFSLMLVKLCLKYITQKKAYLHPSIRRFIFFIFIFIFIFYFFLSPFFPFFSFPPTHWRFFHRENYYYKTFSRCEL